MLSIYVIVGKSSELVQSTCWWPVTHALTCAQLIQYSAVYRFGSLSSLLYCLLKFSALMCVVGSKSSAVCCYQLPTVGFVWCQRELSKWICDRVKLQICFKHEQVDQQFNMLLPGHRAWIGHEESRNVSVKTCTICYYQKMPLWCQISLTLSMWYFSIALYLLYVLPAGILWKLYFIF